VVELTSGQRRLVNLHYYYSTTILYALALFEYELQGATSTDTALRA
jgi:hypothetical protein